MPDRAAGIKRLQGSLNDRGAHLKVDGDYGPLTEAATMKAIGGEVRSEVVETKPPVKAGDPVYWKPGPFHPIFNVPAPYTHLHPIDILRSVAGEKEILGSKDNPLIAHFHEHSGNLGVHSEGADYHDEVPHCASAQNWAADGAGCEKSNNALASSWGKPYITKYNAREYKVGEMVPEGSLVCLGSHITLANRAFQYTKHGTFEGFGSNQGNTIKTSTYSQSKIIAICAFVPKPSTRLAPIGTDPVASTGVGNESTT